MRVLVIDDDPNIWRPAALFLEMRIKVQNRICR